MIKLLGLLLTVTLFGVLAGCGTDPELEITPNRPEFADTTRPPNPIDHRIYADVDPTLNAIWIEWRQQGIDSVSGYDIYRSSDTTLDDQGLLLNRSLVTHLESENQLLDPLPTSYRDTSNIIIGVRYWYQLRAFYKSATNKITYSPPSTVDFSTSFQLDPSVQLILPVGGVSIPAEGLTFFWQDPVKGGTFQIIVERQDEERFVWSALLPDEFGSSISVSYPASATPLVSGTYRWRVKRINPYGGSSSSWLYFHVS